MDTRPPPHPSKHPSDDLVSIRLAAALAGVSHRCVWRWVSKGLLKLVPDRRPARILLRDLEDLLGHPFRDADMVEASRDLVREREGYRGPLYQPVQAHFAEGRP